MPLLHRVFAPQGNGLQGSVLMGSAAKENYIGFIIMLLSIYRIQGNNKINPYVVVVLDNNLQKDPH